MYLQRYGDPTAMGEGNLPEDDQNVDPTENPEPPKTDNLEPQKNFLPVIIGGAAFVVLAAAVAVTLAVKHKNEKKKEKDRK